MNACLAIQAVFAYYHQNRIPPQMPAVHQDSSMHIYKYHQISILKVGGEMPTLQAYMGNNQHLQNKLG